MVSFQHCFLQSLQLYFFLLSTLLCNGFFYLVFPSFPICLLWFFLLFWNFCYFCLLDILLFLMFFVIWLILALLWWCELSPMFVHFADASDMCLVLISSESFRAIDADQCTRSTSAHDMVVTLFLFERYITVFADKSDHIELVETL